MSQKSSRLKNLDEKWEPEGDQNNVDSSKTENTATDTTIKSLVIPQNEPGTQTDMFSEGSKFMKFDSAKEMLEVEKEKYAKMKESEPTQTNSLIINVQVDEQAIQDAEKKKTIQQQNNQRDYESLLKNVKKQNLAINKIYHPSENSSFIHRVMEVLFMSSIAVAVIYLTYNQWIANNTQNWNFIGQFLILLFFLVGSRSYSNKIESLARSQDQQLLKAKKASRINKLEKLKNVNHLTRTFANWLTSLFNWSMVSFLFVQQMDKAFLIGAFISAVYLLILTTVSRSIDSKNQME